MLRELTVRNIRVFEGKDWDFPLNRLTVFCGVNSAGKSTLLKMLLLLRQSQSIQENYSAESGKLRFVGSQADMGDYGSLVSHNDLSQDITIALTVDTVVERKLMQQVVSKQAISIYPAGSQIHCQLKARFTFCSKQVDLDANNLAEIPPFNDRLDEVPPDFLREASFELIGSKQTIFAWKLAVSLDKGRRVYNLSVPREYIQGSNTDLKTKCKIDGLLPSPRILVDLPRQLKLPKAHLVAEIIVSASQSLIDALRAVRYIGPIRAPAKRYYLTYADSRPPMDVAGEYLPYILKDQSKYNSFYVEPGSAALSPQQARLSTSLNIWLHYMRTGRNEQVASNEVELTATKAFIEIKVKNAFGKESHALTDSGFGYSQVLPILVTCLAVRAGDVLIIEQPELHLNPALQVRLAEFLVAMARAGKQVLIETHSEHIVNTIRVLTAEDETGEFAGLCSVFYLSSDNDSPQVTELSIRPDGIIPDWPQQFFGEAASLTGRLLRAQKRFRTQTRKA